MLYGFPREFIWVRDRVSSAQAELNESYFPAFRTAVRESSPTGVMCCTGLPLVLPSACLCNPQREGGGATRLRSGGRVAACTFGCWRC